jgi:hypothetical protein
MHAGSSSVWSTGFNPMATLSRMILTTDIHLSLCFSRLLK